jgi:hypothetical protein
LNIRKAVIILGFLLLGGCTTSINASDRAKNALIDFFDLLNQGQYLAASDYYGGDYGTLTGMNPDINSSDHAQLWENACEYNGFVCLSVLKATLKGTEGDQYIFEVEFKQPDGSIFSRGACCGEDPASVIPQTTFIYYVLATEMGKFLVLDLPVYIP